MSRRKQKRPQHLVNADPGGPRLATQGEKHTFDVQLVSSDHFEATVYLYYRLTLLMTAYECRKSALFFSMFPPIYGHFFGGDSCLVLNEQERDKKKQQISKLIRSFSGAAALSLGETLVG